ncbi:hypothetical protein [Amycolatopsis jejuensis]|nr:hypothetical protein [Amycolatopsis jejuensis]
MPNTLTIYAAAFDGLVGASSIYAGAGMVDDLARVADVAGEFGW